MFGYPDDCKAKCLEFSNCNYIQHGWTNGDWCVAKEKCKQPLLIEPTDCVVNGEGGGDKGVRTYELVSGSLKSSSQDITLV